MVLGQVGKLMSIVNVVMSGVDTLSDIKAKGDDSRVARVEAEKMVLSEKLKDGSLESEIVIGKKKDVIDYIVMLGMVSVAGISFFPELNVYLDTALVRWESLPVMIQAAFLGLVAKSLGGKRIVDLLKFGAGVIRAKRKVKK